MLLLYAVQRPKMGTLGHRLAVVRCGRQNVENLFMNSFSACMCLLWLHAYGAQLLFYCIMKLFDAFDASNIMPFAWQEQENNMIYIFYSLLNFTPFRGLFLRKCLDAETSMLLNCLLCLYDFITFLQRKRLQFHPFFNCI